MEHGAHTSRNTSRLYIYVSAIVLSLIEFWPRGE